MILFYSGDDFANETPTPERVLVDKKPSVMMSYWWFYQKRKMTRWERHLVRRRKGKGNAKDDRIKRGAS